MSTQPEAHGRRHLVLIGIIAGVVALVGVAAFVLPAGASGLFKSASSSGSSSSSAAALPRGDLSGSSVPSAGAAASASAAPSASASAAPKTAGACARPVGASPAARITQVGVGSAVKGYGGEGDTEPLPMAIAATPSGGSWLAWL